MNTEDVFFGLIGWLCMLTVTIMFLITPFLPFYQRRKREGTLDPNKSFLENFFSA